MEDQRYPIGKYIEQPYSVSQKEEWLLDIRSLPPQIEYAITNLDHHQLEEPYREGGWTVKQLMHHVADSHMNAYIRFKLGLTEEKPVIKPYNQQAWAEMQDTKNIPVNVSVTILYAVHERWYEILTHVTDEEWNRVVVHPEHGREMSLWYLLGMYAWHGKHHVAHITSLRQRKGW